MSIGQFLRSEFGSSELTRIFLVNIYEHCQIEHLSRAVVLAAFEKMKADTHTVFDLDDDNATAQKKEAERKILSFRDHATSIDGPLEGALKPDTLEYCQLARVYKYEVFEAHLSAAVVAARKPEYIANPITGGDIWPNWFTQDHDLLPRSGKSEITGPISPNFAISRLGLIHFLDKPTTACVARLNIEKIANNARRPTSVDGEANAAYLAVSEGEWFNRRLHELSDTTEVAPPEHGRALELEGVERQKRLIDGGIEVIISLTNQQVAENLIGEVQIVGPVEQSPRRQATITSEVDRLRCSQNRLEEIYRYFQDDPT